MAEDEVPIESPKRLTKNPDMGQILGAESILNIQHDLGRLTEKTNHLEKSVDGLGEKLDVVTDKVDNISSQLSLWRVVWVAVGAVVIFLVGKYWDAAMAWLTSQGGG